MKIPEMPKTAGAMLLVSVLLGIMGQLVEFYPGAELWWYSLCAVLLVPGLLHPKRWVRAVSVGMLLLWSATAALGYVRGREYREWLRAEEEMCRSWLDGREQEGVGEDRQ